MIRTKVYINKINESRHTLVKTNSQSGINNDSNSDVNPFQIFMLILSLHVVISSILQLVFDLSANVSEILTSVDNIICLFFFTDFIIRFNQAENKLKFMKWGWIDLLSSIPMVEQLQFIRIIRIARILRAFQQIRSSKIMFKMIFEHRFKATFSLVSAVSFVLVTFGAIGILLLEQGQPGSNINNGIDALWWSFVTITTVGYGDYYPVTTGGRIIAAMLMTAGVGLFGTFTGFISSWFVDGGEQTEQQNPKADKLYGEITELKQDIAELKQLISQQYPARGEHRNSDI